MSFHGACIWRELNETRTVAERRGEARWRHRHCKKPVPSAGRLCLFCRGPLTNGSAVCSNECDEGWWQICPTIDGELWIGAAVSRDQSSRLAQGAMVEFGG
jgi:hypothetical protein